MKILVTGASGFIGNFLLAALRDAGHAVRAASRSRMEQQGIDYVLAPELGPDADWSRALNGVFFRTHLGIPCRKPSARCLKKPFSHTLRKEGFPMRKISISAIGVLFCKGMWMWLC